MRIDKYKSRERGNVTDGTIKSRVSALERFQDDVGFTGEPTPQDVADWIDHLLELEEQNEISRGTMRQYYKAVKYYFTKMKGGAEEIEHIRDWIPSGGTDHGDYLEEDELEKMTYNAFAQRERVILELMYRYARRPTEIVLLNVEDVNLTEYEEGNDCPECSEQLKQVPDDYYRLVCPSCKHEEKDTITFPILKKDEPFRATFHLLERVKGPLQTYLELYRSDAEAGAKQEWEEGLVEPLFTTSHGRISYDTVYERVRKIADKAGIDKNITPKSLRHSRATHLDRQGKSPENIARHQLVHGPDTQTVSNYIHPRDEDEVREVMVTDDE